METESYSGEEEVEDDQDYTNPALKKRRDATAIDALPPAPETPPPTIPSPINDDSNLSGGDESDDEPTGMNSGQNEDNDLLGNGETSKESSSNDLNLSASATTVYTGAQRAALQSARTPLERFRAIAQTIKHNLKWAKMLSLPKQDDQQKSQFTVEHEDGPDTSLTFNVNAFKANVQTVNTLPTAVKLILRKNPWERTTADLAYVFSFIDKLKCFERYSSTVRQELSCVLHYESFEDGRVIVRQGHPGLSFYFILSGTVIVEVTEEDKRTGERNTHIIGENTAGSSFGELSLLHGSRRTATISCKGDTEFLRLDKPDFDLVLRRSYQQEWDTRMSALRSLAAFGHWSEEELSATNDRAKLEEFLPNTPIISNLTQSPDDIYFIKSGVCKVVREFTLLQSCLPFGHTKLSLPPLDANHNVPESFKPERYQRVVRKLLHVANIGRGKFFGVGEDLHGTHIISTGKVECILVSRVSFMRHDRGISLEQMQSMVSQLYPSYDETFANFLLDKKWRAYKRRLVKELMQKRNIPNNTTREDVPLILRQQDMQ
ncbi:uncharacterized protein [Asterias amurensis]|uniref:uncharacterized protein isoform X1 n=2 Tax=Asterias amurensis TaxID=7602 RepID=UPI003AB3D2E3